MVMTPGSFHTSKNIKKWTNPSCKSLKEMKMFPCCLFISTYFLKVFAQTTVPALARNEDNFSDIRPFEKNLGNTSGLYYHFNDVYEYEEETAEFKGQRNFQVMELNLPFCKGPMTSQGLSEEEKNGILQLHNDLRNKISRGKIEGLPRAKFMSRLIWNSSLENECRKWLNLCPDGFHYAHPPSAWQTFPYGQNMAWGQSSIKEAAFQWFDEYKPYVKAGVDPLIYRESTDEEVQENKLGMIGHFTAMTNAKSFAMGCYKVMADAQVIDFQTIYCCNYSPPGNVILVQENGEMNNIPAYEVVDTESLLSSDSNENDSNSSKTPYSSVKIQKSTVSTSQPSTTKKEQTSAETPATLTTRIPKKKRKTQKNKLKKRKSKSKRKSKRKPQGRKSKEESKKSQREKTEMSTSNASKKVKKKDDEDSRNETGLISLLKDNRIKSFRDAKVVVVLINPPIEMDTVEVTDIEEVEENLIESLRSNIGRRRLPLSRSLKNNSHMELLSMYS